MITFTDIEFIVLLFLLFILFITGLRKKEEPSALIFSGIDLQMSRALKAVACVFILMGHYVTIVSRVREMSSFSSLIQLTTANIALALFMFFSGYGLSLKKSRGGGIFLLGSNDSKRFIFHYCLHA